MSGAQMAVAAAGGYILGRSRKTKWVLLVGGLVAGRALGKSPNDLLEQGTKALRSSPQLNKLSGDLSGRLLDAGKAAAVKAASSQMESLTDRLNEQAETLRRASEPSEAQESPAAEEAPPAEAPSAEEAPPEEASSAAEGSSTDEESAEKPSRTGARRSPRSRSATATKSRQTQQTQQTQRSQRQRSGGSNSADKSRGERPRKGGGT